MYSGFALLRSKLHHALAHGHEHVILTAPKKSSPRNWDRCTVVAGKPGLWGRCVGQAQDNRFVFDVKTAELEAFLVAHGERDEHG